MDSRRLDSVARAASSMNSRSPRALVVAIRTPDFSEACPLFARSQFSARAVASFSVATCFLVSSRASACFFWASSSGSLPESLGMLALATGAEAAVPAATAAALSALPAIEFSVVLEGSCTIFFFKISAGGARSLKTFRPSLSIHCHWAAADKAIRLPATAKTAETTETTVFVVNLKSMNKVYRCAWLSMLFSAALNADTS